MKRSKVLLFTFLIFLFSASIVFAADGDIGFIQKLKNRFFKKKEVAVVKKEPAAAKIDTAIPVSAKAPSDAVSKESAANSASTSSAETASKEVKAEEAKEDGEKPRAKFTKKEILEHLNGVLEYEEGVLGFVKELKKDKDENGKVFYRYLGTRLEDLDEETLNTVFVRVQNEAGRIRAERLNKQLENIQQAQRATLAAQQAQRAAFTPPQPPPRPPQPPPQPPQIPKPPPTPYTPPRQQK